jgi:polar amino acid transport system ATP-binding protein
MTTSNPILKIENITKSFNGNPILKGVDVKLNKGEIKILIGPSGGGKSTLLQCMNFLITPDSGKFWLEGKPVDITNKKRLYRYRQQVGMIFQDFNLFDHLTTMDNVTIALRKIKKMSKKDAQERAMIELSQVGLKDKGLLYPAELSGGQKQRVAIARALVMDPKVLLLDEPVSALDPEVMGEVIDVIRNLAKKGMTMIMATHQISMVRTLADEILFMKEGCVVEQGQPKELLIAGTRTQGFCDKLNTLFGDGM